VDDAGACENVERLEHVMEDPGAEIVDTDKGFACRIGPAEDERFQRAVFEAHEDLGFMCIPPLRCNQVYDVCLILLR
jgi:hypothetical protein